ncbi:MAG TPA: hypothetical protein PLH23_18850 [Hyphomonadaceae bacterium]|nr:hypothetical protein [Hyphomonadaceae bacterium]HPI50339.1 hypothetical protein [Hyphomonadaceae bacterium]
MRIIEADGISPERSSQPRKPSTRPPLSLGCSEPQRGSVQHLLQGCIERQEIIFDRQHGAHIYDAVVSVPSVADVKASSKTAFLGRSMPAISATGLP